MLEANDDESDDEIEIGAAVISFKCPLSITTFVNPVSSYAPLSDCGHIRANI